MNFIFPSPSSLTPSQAPAVGRIMTYRVYYEPFVIKTFLRVLFICSAVKLSKLFKNGFTFEDSI